MARVDLSESVVPNKCICPRCKGVDDFWTKTFLGKLAGFNLYLETDYHNPCGYVHSVLRVDGKIAGERTSYE